jgi:hypothetical protein
MRVIWRQWPGTDCAWSLSWHGVVAPKLGNPEHVDTARGGT